MDQWLIGESGLREGAGRVEPYRYGEMEVGEGKEAMSESDRGRRTCGIAGPLLARPVRAALGVHAALVSGGAGLAMSDGRVVEMSPFGLKVEGRHATELR